MDYKSHKREFDRYPMDFVLEVTAEDISGNKYKDTAVLKDISGGGVKFITQLAGKYFPGQRLEMTIYLPGTDEVKARMKGKATVVRIDPASNSGVGEKSQGMSIAVKLDTRLNFERTDAKARENRGESPENL